MEILRDIVVVLHILGAAAIIGTYLHQLGHRTHFELRWAHIGAGVQLITGLVLVSLGYALGRGEQIDNAKIGLKLALAILVLVAVMLTARSKESAKRAWFHVAGITAIANVAVAVLWR